MIPYVVKDCNAVIVCPFCSAHLGKTVKHYHGACDTSIPGDGDGYRASHCDTKEKIEFELPDGTIVDSRSGYSLKLAE